MATHPTLKRTLPDPNGNDNAILSSKKAKRTRTKACITCNETATTFPKISSACHGTHSNDVCKLCWKKYISVEIMAKPFPGAEQCVQCPAVISYDDLKRILSTKDLEHYDWLIRRSRAKEQGERECLGSITDAGGNQVTCHSLHHHDRATDGRIFQCKKCGDEQCLDCGVREHRKETCQAFQARLELEHGDEEAKTSKAFAEGYEGKEVFKSGGKEGQVRMIVKMPKPCETCGALMERAGGCKHVTCLACKNQFCIECNAACFGPGSVPELGNQAHRNWCVYFKREKEDRRFVRRVKKVEEEVE